MTEGVDWRNAPEADFAVIGDPISHSRSPAMHQAAYRAAGLDLRYVALRVPPGEVGKALSYLTKRGYRGANVTVPHKIEAMGWVRKVGAISRRVGAINTIRLSDRTGINTDVAGFLDVLCLYARPTDSKQILVLGAGGTARAVLVGSELVGGETSLWNRTRDRAHALKEELDIKVAIAESAIVWDGDWVVNTTSASLQGASLPIDWQSAGPETRALDMAYGADSTPFVLAARERGVLAIDGREMLVRQGARAFRWWLGISPDLDAMRQAIQ